MLTILTGKIKHNANAWNWIEQAQLVIPARVKVIKKIGISCYLVTIEGMDDPEFPTNELGETDYYVPQGVNTGQVSIYLNDEKMSEEILLNHVVTNKLSLTHMMRKVNRAVRSGDKLIVTPISPNALRLPYTVYLKVYIEY